MKNRIVRLTFVFIGLIILGLMFSGPGYTGINPKSAVLMWLFEEGDGDVAEDLTDNGNDGEIMNGAKWAKGQFGGGLELDGADDHIISRTAEGVGATFFSETLWIKFKNFNAENQFGYIRCTHTIEGI